MLVAMQAVQLISPPHAGLPLRPIDLVGMGGWTLMTLAVLFALTTGGGYGYGRTVRALVNDESTMANRDIALRAGFVVVVLIGIGLYLASFIAALESRLACHLILNMGLAAALIRFGTLDRRAHTDA